MPASEKSERTNQPETINKINKGFRLSQKTTHQLSALAERMATSQTEIIERSIAECYEEYDRGFHYIWADSINNLIKLDCVSPDVDENTPHYTTVRQVLDALYPERLAEEGYAVFSVSDGLLVYLGEKFGFDDQTEEGKVEKFSPAKNSDFIDNFDLKKRTHKNASAPSLLVQAMDLADIVIALHKEKDLTVDQAIKLVELTINKSIGK